MKRKYLYTLDEVAILLEVSLIQVQDFIWHGDLKTVGSRREHIRYVDIVEFVGEPLKTK